MKFTAPTIIHDMPKIEDFSKYRGGANIMFRVFTRIYWRTLLSEAQNHRCCWCGIRMIETPNKHNSETIEHIIPRCDDGDDHPDNFAVSCLKCNQLRGNRSVEDFINNVPIKKVEFDFNRPDTPRRALLKKELAEFGIFASPYKGANYLERKLMYAKVTHAIRNKLGNVYENGTKEYDLYIKLINTPKFDEWR